MYYRGYLRKVPIIIQCSESHGVAEADTATAFDTVVMVLKTTPSHHLTSNYRYSLNLK